MPKKKKNWGEDTRGLKAKEQKEKARKEKELERERELQREREAEWQKGANKRAQKKAEEERKKQEEKERWEALKAQQKEEEEKELDRLKKAKGKSKGPLGPSVTPASASAASAAVAPARGTDKVAERREKAVEARGDEIQVNESASDAVWASGLDAALESLTTGDNGAATGGAPASGVDRHPERRAKAAYRAFEEREMPKLKEEFPQLRHQQRKNKLFKMWKKSPENPMNQDNPAYNTKA